MGKYIAWLNGASVAVGSLAEVERKAREIADSKRWREFESTAKLRITTYGAQRFVKSIVLY